MFQEDLITQLEEDSVGTLNTNLFATLKSKVPMLVSGAATCQITITAGPGPDNTHNATIFPAYLRTTAQLMFRADKSANARAMADAAYRSLVKVRNEFINSGWYRSIKPLQSEPFEMPVDDRGQACYAFNALGDYKPPVAE